MITIKTNAADERSAILAYLLELGYCWHGKAAYSLKSINEEYPFYIWSNVNVFPDRGQISGNQQSESACSFEEVVGKLPSHKLTTTIELNDEHTAIVSQNGVKVGCQTFSFEKVKELYKAVEEIEQKSE